MVGLDKTTLPVLRARTGGSQFDGLRSVILREAERSVHAVDPRVPRPAETFPSLSSGARPRLEPRRPETSISEFKGTSARAGARVLTGRISLEIGLDVVFARDQACFHGRDKRVLA